MGNTPPNPNAHSHTHPRSHHRRSLSSPNVQQPPQKITLQQGHGKQKTLSRASSAHDSSTCPLYEENVTLRSHVAYGTSTISQLTQQIHDYKQTIINLTGELERMQIRCTQAETAAKQAAQAASSIAGLLANQHQQSLSATTTPSSSGLSATMSSNPLSIPRTPLKDTSSLTNSSLTATSPQPLSSRSLFSKYPVIPNPNATSMQHSQSQLLSPTRSLPSKSNTHSGSTSLQSSPSVSLSPSPSSSMTNLHSNLTISSSHSSQASSPFLSPSSSSSTSSTRDMDEVLRAAARQREADLEAFGHKLVKKQPSRSSSKKKDGDKDKREKEKERENDFTHSRSRDRRDSDLTLTLPNDSPIQRARSGSLRGASQLTLTVPGLAYHAGQLSPSLTSSRDKSTRREYGHSLTSSRSPQASTRSHFEKPTPSHLYVSPSTSSNSSSSSYEDDRPRERARARSEPNKKSSSTYSNLSVTISHKDVMAMMAQARQEAHHGSGTGHTPASHGTMSASSSSASLLKPRVK